MTERAAVRRRVAAVLSAGVLALGALSACRSDVGVAAYVGGDDVTQTTVDNVVASVPASLFSSEGDARSFMASIVTFNELAAKFSAEKGYGTASASESDMVGLAAAVHVQPADATKNAFIQEYTLANAWRTLLLSKVTAVTPSQGDLMDAYNNLVAESALQPGTTFQQIEPSLLQIPDLGKGVALRDQLDAAAKKYDISVNPRYAGSCQKAPCTALQYPIFQFVPPQGQSTLDIYFVDMGQTSDPATIDAPKPPAALNAAAAS